MFKYAKSSGIFFPEEKIHKSKKIEAQNKLHATLLMMSPKKFGIL